MPCGKCLGCRTTRTRDWAIRCTLELRQHDVACWATLTYDEENRPTTLDKAHLSGWLKRLRARLPEQRIRFFASGEYGEETQRPHYHAILYGTADRKAIQLTWPYGHTRVDPVSDAAIQYVAGYCAKKLGWEEQYRDVVDPETGEVLEEHQAPFILMSRKPGIGGDARKHWKSWRKSAVHNGEEVPVPRYLHDAWKAHATEEEIARLAEEKKREALSRDTSRERRAAAAEIAAAKLNNQARRRKGV